MKEKIIGILISTLILTSALNMTFIIGPSLAEDIKHGLFNQNYKQITNKATLPNKDVIHDIKEDKNFDSFSQTSQDSVDRWNFNDTSKWSNSVYRDGNKTRLIVGVYSNKSENLRELERIATKHQAKIVNTVSIRGQVRAAIVELLFMSVTAFVEEIRSFELASYIEPDMEVQAQFVPNDPCWSMQWGPQKIEVDWAWNVTVGDPSVLVAVVDTGIYHYHEDLAENYVPLGYDWVNLDNDPLDDAGHGTHCAGIIAAVLNNSEGMAGLAQVRIMAEKVLNINGHGSWDWVAQGVIHATDCGANIISLSLGGYGYSELLHEAVKYAYDAGVLIIAAAGNDNANVKLYPAGYDEVIAVAATDQNDNKAWFSNWGDWIEIAAPGVDIYSTVPWGYEIHSGTSMATPHVSGVAALLWSQYSISNKTRDWMRLWLRYASDDLGDSGYDIYYGFGRVNARKTIEQSPPEHELIAFEWTTPPYVEPGALATINVTVINFGQNNETDVVVQLSANDTIVDSAMISLLVSGNSATVDLIWNPEVEGLYNVTINVLPVLGETNVKNNFLWKCIYVGVPVKVVVLHSAGNIHGDIIPNWQVLNREWHNFGDIMIYIDYTTLNKEDITYEDIAQTKADVLIISCAYDPDMGWQFKDSEIEAIKQYTYEGHGLIATAGTLYAWVPNNNKLAPLFGLTETTTFDVTGTDLLHLLNTTEPLFKNIPNPFVFPNVATTIPRNSRWDSNKLAGGKYLALGHFQESAIITYRGLVYISPWLEIIPSYYHHHLQLLYNAITWSRYQKPEHELVVSLDVPKYLLPGESALLNATVSNMGLSNETDVKLYLLVDGTVVDSATIPELLIGASSKISYLWTPTVEEMYNVTAYSPPLTNEEFTFNNAVTKIVRVMIPPKVAVLGDYQSQLTDLLLENGIIAQERDWDIMTDIYEYDVVVINRPSDPGLAKFLALIEATDEYGVGLVFTSSWPGMNEPYGISLLQWYLRDPEGQGHAYGQGPVYYQLTQEHPIFEGKTIGDIIHIISIGDGDHAWFWNYSGVTIANIGADYTGIQGRGVAYKIRENGNKHLLLAGLAPQQYANMAHWTEEAKFTFVQGVFWASKPVIYEHNLSVSLDVPSSLELNNSVMLNATVRNRGLNDETDVELYLLINDTIVYNVTIDELQVTESYSINYLWTPTETGHYNITAYAPPAPGEDYITNNIVTKETNVFFYMRLYLLHEWIGSGAFQGWHADDISWQYTLPFDFPFYGAYYRTIHVSSNGLITFLNQDFSHGNSRPALGQKLAIAPAWDDWVTYDPYDIYIWRNSTHVGLRWYVRAFDSSVVANFEAVLRFDGVIQFNYEYSDDLVSATVGISDGLGHILAEDLSNLNCINSIVFIPFPGERDVAINSVEPATNEVAAGETVDIAVVVENQGSFPENFAVTAYATHQESSTAASSLSSARIFLDPSVYMFDTDMVSVGYRFNVTVKVADVEDLTIWQVGMYYDGGILRATRWFEPKWDSAYVFYGRETVKADYFGDYFLWVGAIIVPGPPEQEPFSGDGKLCIIEFEITAVPPQFEKYSCPLNINNEDTFLLDSHVEDISVVKEDGYYELSSVLVPGTYVIGMLTVTNLAPGERAILTFAWNTTEVPLGDYIVYAVASAVPYEIDRGDNVCYDGVITVKIGEVIFHDVAVVDVAVPSVVVYQGWIVTINVSVTNFGNGTESFTVTLYYDNTVIATQNVDNLEPSAMSVLSFNWDTTNIPYHHTYTLKAVASVVEGETNTTNNIFSDCWIEVRVMGDVNSDGVVDMRDIGDVCIAFGAYPGRSNWNFFADLNRDGRVDLRDIGIACCNYLKGMP